MEITRRTDYAIRMLLELARDGGEPISVRALAEHQGVPYAFARAVQRDLVGAKLVKARRGAAGGITLARPAEEITLLDIVAGMQGDPSIATCAGDPQWCDRSHSCSMHRVWCGANDLIRDYLGGRTLASLVIDNGR
ncbi:MAG: Rrf2 family transcriptional regulator [Coriobacteriales bacterium]|nr:Rrf2 family transcriptional regulator [Coriobacteriales bacterium]